MFHQSHGYHCNSSEAVGEVFCCEQTHCTMAFTVNHKHMLTCQVTWMEVAFAPDCIGRSWLPSSTQASLINRVLMFIWIPRTGFFLQEPSDGACSSRIFQGGRTVEISTCTLAWYPLYWVPFHMYLILLTLSGPEIHRDEGILCFVLHWQGNDNSALPYLYWFT